MANDTDDFPFLARAIFSTESCYGKFMAGNIFDVPCLQLLFSKLISYIIIAFTSLFVKMPQAVKVYRAKTGDGLNMNSQLLIIMVGIISISYSMAKHFPLSIWGEILVLNAQQVLIVYLVYWYDNKRRLAVIFSLLYFVTLTIFISPWIPLSVHVVLQAVNIPLSTISKLMQIWTNWQNQRTGQLSAMTVIMQGLRCAGRLYSNVVETGDIFRIILYSEATCLNMVLFLQILYYAYKVEDESSKDLKKGV